MPVNKDKVVQWFYDNRGKITYSMDLRGSGTHEDCSSSMTKAVYAAGGTKYGRLYSTVDISGYLAANKYTRISVNQSWDAKKGDIVMMSWGDPTKGMSASAGAGGHIGVMEDDIRFISVDYWTGGTPGTAVSSHEWNYYYAVNQPTYIEVWRLDGSIESKPVTPVTPTPSPAPVKQNDVDYMANSGYVKWNGKVINVDDRAFVNGLWQVINNQLAGAQVTATTSMEEWTNNGVPMSAISWADGTPNSSTNGGSFRFDQDLMAIVDRDVASNGIAVLMAGHKVWVDATFARKA